MAAGEEKSNDFYAVLGLKKECTASELRNAYKRLALMWHPDRCSSSGNSKFVEEAKKKFQAIQEAYSVLSDANKRFLYDVGAYDSDDDENGMGDFLNEMAVMMSQTKSNENGKESFEELQELFEDMFQRDVDAFNSASHHPMNSFPSSTSTSSYCESSNANNKRNSAEMGSGRMMSAGESSAFDAHFQSFCFGAARQGDFRRGKGARGGIPGGANGRRRRTGRKQKVSSGHDVSSNDYYSHVYT
ncbi:uncharacterized protein LOC100251506 isoform X1 [Vitis vinifera]|uniref:J domain-containing protein n=1 Tax=Vitis vinifera TaxID=29760 RepID=F6HXQ0_VITVI|nr:uncharacterized protein LOC100251506 isoform X1 [Vitis vinifera]|eukprot:XP_002269039.1 PREDICTED: dnaJ homolog subfamily B member 6-A isoform X1 [Vitis vinifera]